MGKQQQQNEVDFLHAPENSSRGSVKKSQEKKQKSHRGFWLGVRIFSYLMIVLIMVGFTVSYRIIFSSEGVLNTEETPILEQFKQLISPDEKMLKGELDDRVNILLVGIGGPGHSGSYLADTIILTSFQPSTNDVAMLSIPRDLFVPIPGFNWRKINNASAFGYLKGDAGGEELLTEVVEDITEQTVHYYARVDFEAFRRIVDAVDGVEIDVERAFTDYQYPDYSYGYQTISFDTGLQEMDGEESLQFVRSRHGNNGEGSDFARALRQQKVLRAIYEKVFSLGTILNPSTMFELFDIVGDHAKTNMEMWEILKLGHISRTIDLNSITNRVLDSSANSPLYATTTIDGAYILRPKAGLDDFSEVAAIAEDIFNLPVIEDVEIVIQNGTTTSGLAKQVADEFIENGYSIASYGNAARNDYEETVIYDLTLGRYPATLTQLKGLLNAHVATTVPVFLRDEASFDKSEMPLNIEPDFLVEELGESTFNADFIIVLGEQHIQTGIDLTPLP